MVAPRHLFLDTSVLEGQQYNFASHALGALVQVAGTLPLTLLLPRPTEMEVKRHISRRAEEAVKTLEDARRRAPFLEKWENWPLKKDDPLLKDHFVSLAQREYDQFKHHFSATDLDYSAVDLKEVMEWYDGGRAPFDSGKKKHEFPDALALSALLSYARATAFAVAVVSSDKDFQNACALHNELVSFASIPALVDALVDEQGRIKKLIEDNKRWLIDAISDAFPNVGFYTREDPFGDVEDVHVEDVTLTDVNTLELGDTEATCAFVARIDYSAYISFRDPESTYRDSDDGSIHTVWWRAGKVHDSVLLEGVATVSLAQDWSAIEDVSEIVFETNEVAVDGYPDVKYD